MHWSVSESTLRATIHSGVFKHMTKEILDLLCVEDEEGRIEMARKLERAAKKTEALHLPFLKLCTV